MERIWLKVGMFSYVNFKNWYHFLFCLLFVVVSSSLLAFSCFYIYAHFFFLAAFLTFHFSSFLLLWLSSVFVFNFSWPSSPRLKADSLSCEWLSSLCSILRHLGLVFPLLISIFFRDTCMHLESTLWFIFLRLSLSENRCISSGLLIYKSGKQCRLGGRTYFPTCKVVITVLCSLKISSKQSYVKRQIHFYPFLQNIFFKPSSVLIFYYPRDQKTQFPVSYLGDSGQVI